MSSPPSNSANARRARKAVDAVVYAVAVAAVVFALGTILGVLLGGGLVTAKYVMFLLGILLFGYATFQLRPDPPWDTTETEEGELKVTKNEQNSRVVGERDETRFQAAVQRIPPLPWYSLPPNQRFSVGFKLFLASLATLAWSFVLETVFGVMG